MGGVLLMIVGMALYGWLAGHYGDQVTAWHVAVPFLLIGVGMGQVMAPLQAVMLADVPQRDAGAASGVINATTQLGAATGVVLIGLVSFSALRDEGYVGMFQSSLWYVGGALAVVLVLMFALPGRRPAAQHRRREPWASSGRAPPPVRVIKGSVPGNTPAAGTNPLITRSVG